MAGERCGAKTQKGTPCGWAAAECPHHRRDGRPSRRPERGADHVPAAPPAKAEFPWLAAHDLRGLGWWLIEQVLLQELETGRASVVANLVRTLAALGPAPEEESAALREVELRGRLMHGLPPRTPEEWARAEAVFDDAALAEFRRWERLLLEADDGDGLEPLDLGQGGAGEIDVPLVIDAEDGV